MPKNKFYFEFGVKEGVNYADARDAVKEYAESLEVSSLELEVDSASVVEQQFPAWEVIDREEPYLQGYTTQNAYEKLWDCKIRSKKVSKSFPSGTVKAVVWEEVTPAKVPKSLEQYLVGVHLPPEDQQAPQVFCRG